jgi:hypothetical protein
MVEAIKMPANTGVIMGPAKLYDPAAKSAETVANLLGHASAMNVASHREATYLHSGMVQNLPQPLHEAMDLRINKIEITPEHILAKGPASFGDVVQDDQSFVTEFVLDPVYARKLVRSRSDARKEGVSSIPRKLFFVNSLSVEKGILWQVSKLVLDVTTIDFWQASEKLLEPKKEGVLGALADYGRSALNAPFAKRQRLYLNLEDKGKVETFLSLVRDKVNPDLREYGVGEILRDYLGKPESKSA